MKATLILAALVAAAVTLAPAALADRPDDRGGLLGVGAVQRTSTATRPDDRAEVRGPALAIVMRETAPRPDDRPGIRGPGPAPIVVGTQAPSGFDWSAAGIGALGAFGISLLVFAGAQLVVRERGRHAAV
jgi:hypothetical protein